MITVQKDLTVIGAGLSGMCAAIAAARRGLTVALVNNRPVLGGNSSSEMRMWTRGATGGENIYSEEMGILGEMKLENLYRNPQGNVILWDEVLYDFIYAEPLIDLYLNTHISEIEMSGKSRIVSVSGHQQGTEKYLCFRSTVFIDASGDGTIGYLAGASFAEGREGQALYGERLAPEKGDDLKLGSSILFHTRETRQPVSFTVPRYAYNRNQVRNLIGKGGRIVHERMSGTDYWWIEHGGMLDTIANNQEIALELKKIVFGVWDYVKNSGEFPADNLTLEWVGSLPCKRESRRLKGEKVLTLNDIENGAYDDDGVSYGGWYVDFHPPGGIYAKEEHCIQIPVSVYTIPLGCLYTKKVDNLLFTGRLISTSHLAFASTRIMNTCALLGQAAGTAAVLMQKYGKLHSQIHRDHMVQLKEMLISDDVFIPGCVHQDDLDLAQGSEITVSSTRLPILNLCDHSIVLEDDFLFLISCSPEVTGIKLNVDVSDATGLNVILMNCRQPAGFRTGSEIARASLDLSPGENQWIRLPDEIIHSVRDLVKKDVAGPSVQSFFIQLCASESVSLRCSETTFTGFTGRFRSRKQLYNPCFAIESEAEESCCTCHGSNLINGFNRPFGGPNSWMSDAEESAWVECAMSEPSSVKEIRLYFNPDLSIERVNLKGEKFSDHHGMFPKEQMPPELVRRYTVSVDVDGRWEKVVDIRGNLRRLAVHKLDRTYRTGRVRVDLLETWGSPYFELFEIRIYPKEG